MPGTRKYGSVDETTAKLTVIVPLDIDRELRALAARQGIAVGPMIRGWISGKLKEAERAYRSGQGDLTIAWDKDKHAEMVGHIQALIDRGVTFHRINEKTTGIRKKVAGRPIGSATEILHRNVLITDAEIKKLIDLYPPE